MNAVAARPLDPVAVAALVQRSLPLADPLAGQSIVVQGPTRVARYSSLFRADIGGRPALAVKCLVDPGTGGPDSPVARRQFEALARVYEAMGDDPALRVPKPCFVAEPEGVLAMEWIGGQPLTERLLDARATFASAQALMQRAGRWLRHFHRAHPLPPQPLDVADKLHALAFLESSGAGGRAVREAIAMLRVTAAAAAQASVDRSWLHGDFKSDNVLVDGGITIGIDVHVRHENAVTYDLAAFTNHWSLTLCHPRAWRWWRKRDALAAAFLQSYDCAYLADKRLPFRWTALYMMMSNWQEFTTRKRRSLAHVYLERCFLRLLRRMTRDLEEAARSS